MPRLTPVEGVWAGKPQWRCPACQYVTLDRDRIDQHIDLVHRDDPGPLVRKRIRREQAQARREARKQEQELSHGES